MKKIAVLSHLSAILVTLAISPFSACAAEKEAGYVYTIIDNEATVTGFEGEPVYIEIPEVIDGCRVTEIRDNSFYECGSLKHITLPDTIEKIGHHAFYACYSLESVTIPDSVKEIGMGCFSGCEKLTSAALSDNISRIPDSCFRSCTSLTSFEIGDNITETGDFSFSGCTSLKTVSIGSSVKTIGDCSFYMCGLKSVYIPPTVEFLGVCSVGYTPSEEGAVPIEGYTILGKKKSAAAKYANENSLTFENAEDSVHAFAIQRISGQRIAVPSVFIITGCIMLFALLMSFFSRKRKRRNVRRIKSTSK